MNFSKYGFDEFSQNFPKFKIVYIFLEYLEYFFQKIFQMMLPNICSTSVYNETTKMNTMGTTYEHNRIA